MTIDRVQAAAFVEGYGRTWQAWDYAGFVELFSDDVVYVEHPTDNTVVGRDALERYVRAEHIAQGTAVLRMGRPIVDGDQVTAEFWATLSKPGSSGTLTGCFIARLNPGDGRCTHFREYWFDVEGHRSPFPTWGE